MPKDLKGKSESEIKAYLDQKRAERKSIQNQIRELNLKRKEYVLKNQKQGENNLEQAMMNAIKSQAKKKNYKWE